MKNILLIGNPNVGKTAILNKLVGTNYNIGNWAGVTVTRQEGILITDKEKFHFLDLPGIYSLMPCSEDENISIHEIFTNNYDLIINIIDINNLSQNLMLTTELLELGVPMIGILNFCDEFNKIYNLDISKLQDDLGIPIIPTSAHTGEGIDKLIRMISLINNYPMWSSPLQITTSEQYNDLPNLFPIAKIRYSLSGISPKINSNLIYTYIALEHPELINRFALSKEDINNIVKQNDQIVPDYMDDLLSKKEFLLNRNPITIKTKQHNKLNLIKKIDNLLLHPIMGYVFFGISMSILFTMVFNVANPFIDFIDWIIGTKITSYANILLEDTIPELHSFIVDGLIGGVGGILTFVPLIFILYIFLAILEESGYLARIAILLENPFSKIGLSGKSFFPMLLGFGCTVPAIYGSRVLETPQIRRLTIILSSLISCGARLPVYALFISAFFPQNGGLILLSLYMLGIALAIILALIMSKFSSFNSKNTCFVMVLPSYRWPNIDIVRRKAFFHASSYIKKAGGVILGMLMLIWAFSYFPEKGDISKSYLATAGQVIQPMFIPLGFGDKWEPVVAIIPSLIAKESVVGFFGQVLQSEAEDSNSEITEISKIDISNEVIEISTTFLQTVKQSLIGLVTWNFIDQFGTPSVEELEYEAGTGIVDRLKLLWTDNHAQEKAYSFMIFILLTLPCVAATGALKQELEIKYFIFTILLYLILPFFFSFIYYQLAILF